MVFVVVVAVVVVVVWAMLNLESRSHTLAVGLCTFDRNADRAHRTEEGIVEGNKKKEKKKKSGWLVIKTVVSQQKRVGGTSLDTRMEVCAS